MARIVPMCMIYRIKLGCHYALADLDLANVYVKAAVVRHDVLQAQSTSTNTAAFCLSIRATFFRPT